jgi:hypothetical protein
MQALSEVTETLTLRLLELEERLAATERGLRSGGAPDALQQLMAHTEQRLSRIEQLLASEAPPESESESASLTPRLQVLHAQPPVSVSAGITVRSPAGEDPVNPAEENEETDFVLAEEPFPDDGEQPFMDELIA